MYKLNTYCRACGTPTAPGTKSPATAKLRSVFNLGLQPLANDFCKEEDERAGYAPLEVLLCPRCFLAQLSVTVDPAVLYEHYLYVTSPSKTMHGHFESLLKRIRGVDGCKILEIGCNDGAFLKFLKGDGYSVMGVDPALNQVRKAADAGIPAYCGYWGSDLVRSNTGVSQFKPDFIFARHVFCHVEDWRDFIKGLEMVTGDETRIFIEVPYVQDLLDRAEFDTIYHEHSSYLSIQAMEALLHPTGLDLIEVERLNIHGGALLLTLARKGTPTGLSVPQMLAKEDCGQKAWDEFAVKSHAKIETVRDFVRTQRSLGKRVVGYGASAKSTVWINACGFTRKDIEFIADATPEKQYRFSPGSDIPILPEGLLTGELSDYAICFAWNFFDEIRRKEKIFLERGGKWIIPHPEMKVVGAEELCQVT